MVLYFYFTYLTDLELGSGCGLPGFVAARYAKETVLTDYIDQVLDNLTYNMQLNCQEDEENSQNPVNLKERVRVQYLNWDEIDEDPTVLKMSKYDIYDFSTEANSSPRTLSWDRNSLIAL